MGDILWTAYGDETDALTTELNALADDAESDLGSVIDNTTDRKTFIDLNVVLDSLNPTTGAFIVIRVVTAIDGTNFPDGNASPIYTAQVKTGSAPKRIELRQISIPPAIFKLRLTNKCNVALAATLNTVKYRKYSLTNV